MNQILLIIIRRCFLISKSVDRANNFLNGTIFIHPAVDDLEYMNIDEIWTVNSNNRTYQVYLHSLNMLGYLAESYMETNDQKYLKEAIKVINSWKQYGSNTQFVNHEQAVSTRLLLFIKINELIADKMLLKKMIVDHVNHLLRDEYYVETNHGIMIDRGLSIALPYLKNNEKELYNFVLQTVILRCRNTINRDYSNNNLHLENSTDYHRLATKWLEGIEARLNEIDETIGERYVRRLQRAKELDEIIVSPIKRYPMVGDSGDGRYYGNKRFDNLIDYEAGRAIVHNESFNSQLTFICGYGRKGHKHHDDLSFLFFDGYEYILNDSGKYNYQKNDKIRKHMISPDAHNSFYKINELYKINEVQHVKEKVKIQAFEEFKTHHRIVGKNDGYPGLALKRTIIYEKKTNSIILIDEFNSEQQNTVAVNFNLGVGVRPEKLSRGKYLLHGNHKNTLKLEAHIGRYTDSIIDDSIRHQSKISRRFNEYDENKRVIFRQKTLRGLFITSITTNENNITCEKLNDSIIKITINEDEIFTSI